MFCSSQTPRRVLETHRVHKPSGLGEGSTQAIANRLSAPGAGWYHTDRQTACSRGRFSFPLREIYAPPSQPCTDGGSTRSPANRSSFPGAGVWATHRRYGFRQSVRRMTVCPGRLPHWVYIQHTSQADLSFSRPGGSDVCARLLRTLTTHHVYRHQAVRSEEAS